MNEREPLTPEDLDVLLSAELDGELEDAARELGLSASEAQSRLAAVPGVDARREALTQARDLIAARPPFTHADEDALIALAMPRDDLTAARERRVKSERSRRVLVAVGSVAAAIAVIVGVASMQPASDSNFSEAAAPTVPGQQEAADAGVPPRQLAAPVNLGDVTEADALRSAALGALADLPSGMEGNYTTGKRAVPATPLPTEDGEDSDVTATGSLEAAGLSACARGAPERYRLTAEPTLVADGTVAGAPVVVVIYESDGSRYADVVRVSDCSLLRRQSLG